MSAVELRSVAAVLAFSVVAATAGRLAVTPGIELEVYGTLLTVAMLVVPMFALMPEIWRAQRRHGWTPGFLPPPVVNHESVRSLGTHFATTAFMPIGLVAYAIDPRLVVPCSLAAAALLLATVSVVRRFGLPSMLVLACVASSALLAALSISPRSEWGLLAPCIGLHAIALAWALGGESRKFRLLAGEAGEP